MHLQEINKRMDYKQCIWYILFNDKITPNKSRNYQSDINYNEKAFLFKNVFS